MPPPPAADPGEWAQTQAKRTRALMAVSRSRVGNAWLRIAASAIAAVVATSLTGDVWPLVWLVGLAIVVIIDRVLHQRLLKRCEANGAPKSLRMLVVLTAAGSLYGNILAALLWFAPYVPGETLAVMYLCGGLANAAATLRSSPPLAMAGLGPTIAFLLGLPILEYALGGAQNPLHLMPLIGGLLLLGFGVNLWRSLLASDVAQAQAEVAALRERQAAAAAAAAKSDVIQRINAEFRTPMSALIGAAEHLRRAAASPQARAHISTLVQASEVLKLVLDDFADLDRLENGCLPIKTKATDPRELVRSVVSAFRVAAQDKNLELFLDIAPDTPTLVTIDTLRVRQVLFNLLANAVRYTQHGGIRVRLTAQATDAERVRLNFVVADTGPGMSRSQLAVIFGRTRVTAEGKGPGLGLAISMRLAQLMHGQLTARSELGQGSVFSFVIEASIAVASDRSAA